MNASRLAEIIEKAVSEAVDEAVGEEIADLLTSDVEARAQLTELMRAALRRAMAELTERKS